MSLNGQIHLEKDSHSLSLDAAQWITSCIEQTLKGQDRFTWALSGGNTPRGLYGLLAQSPFTERIAWEKLHLFWGDERDVAFDDPRHNGHMAYETLLSHVPVPSSQIHYIDTSLSAADSAEAYSKILHEYFDGHPHSFDLVLLGLGPDAHTLSLFPGTSVVREKTAWTAGYWLASQQMNRITMTAVPVNLARRVAFLVEGKDKAPALKEVLFGPFDPDKFPSQTIRPLTGELHWFVDRDAAEQLPE